MIQLVYKTPDGGWTIPEIDGWQRYTDSFAGQVSNNTWSSRSLNKKHDNRTFATTFQFVATQPVEFIEINFTADEKELTNVEE